LNKPYTCTFVSDRKIQFPILKVVFAAAISALAIVPAWAQVTGGIYTTNSDGSVVNGNIYASKDLVYLSGGPENKNAAGLSPAPGFYYFQVTDPSGATLLSQDDIKCRVVYVNSLGRVDGIPGTDGSSATAGGFGTSTCYHQNGSKDDANGALPVQLIPYADTPNSGGEYKAWMTPVADYGEACAPNHGSYGFCDSDSKTDNFKIKASGVAYVTVCKFNDQNGDGIQQSTEPLIPHWPITATGVDGDTGSGVLTQTDDTGCVSFSVSDITSNGTQTVTLTEGTQGPDWTQTAPATGQCTLAGAVNQADTCNVSGGVITLTVRQDDNVNAPNFGNYNANCTTGCTGNQVIVTKDAHPVVTYTWSITKSVDKAEIDTAPGGSTAFNYTVDVSHDSGTATMTGTIRVANATGSAINNVGVSDVVSDAATDGGSCTVQAGPFHDGTGTVPAGDHVDVLYSCTFTGMPAAGTNTATASWDSTSSAVGTASFDFSAATIIDGSATVNDPLSGATPLGTASYTDPNPKAFNYSHSVSGTAGTCVTQDNTATLKTNTTATTSNSQKVTVKVCEGADLTVSKTATTSFNSSITKSVDKTIVERAGGNITFNYTVKVTTSGWPVTGNITVKNTNDWEAVTANLVDALSVSGATCTITGGSSQSVPKSSSISPAYTCSFTSVPSVGSGMNTATASWSAATYFTTDGSASGNANYAFTSLTVTDCFGKKGATCASNNLGTVTVPPGSATFTYSRTVSNALGGSCQEYDNTATITQTSQTANAVATVCNTATGALTMGFWQNKNGQGIIATGSSTGGVCNSGTWLRLYAPFQDLNLTSTCGKVGDTTSSTVVGYVYNIIKAANASGAAMNAMLKGQMLATSLDVYISDPALGGNKIAAAQPLGGVKIDLTKVCMMIDSTSGTGTCSGSTESTSAAFGGATSGTVSFLLTYAASQSNLGGSSWYGQIKATQGLAKNTFDAINNQAAYIAP
jgi:hypothetical protein